MFEENTEDRISTEIFGITLGENEQRAYKIWRQTYVKDNVNVNVMKKAITKKLADIQD